MPTQINEEEERDILQKIFTGAITVFSLPTSVFKLNVESLLSAFKQGFGTDSSRTPPGSPIHQLAQSLEGNIKIFSAAKTFQQVRTMSEQVFDANGEKRPFKEFEEIARQTFDDYNRNWLKSEQDTAVTQSQTARKWRRVQDNKDLYPYLEYRTAGDDRVRKEHQRLDGILRHVDDSFWDRNMPPNGWRCRCETRQRQSAPNGVSDVRGVPEPPELFKMNPGRDGFVFKEDVGDGLEHPYFRVDERFEVLKQNGFGLV